MMKSKFCIAALGLVAVSLGVPRADAATYTPAETFYTAGSSAQFNTFGVAASFGSAPFCGTNHWSAKNSTANPITLVDPRSTSILAEPANIWIAWDNNAANQVAGNGVVCFYASVDSIVGVRAFFAHATLSLAAGLVGTADANPDLVPLIGQGVALPQNIYNIVNNAVLNAANTDIRPEDAKFATMRVLSTAGTQVVGRAVTGLGYGPFPIGTQIKSSQSATVANPVDFALVQGDTDPVNSSNPIREYAEVPIGASPVMVIANVSDTAAGHLGDGNYTNINRFILAKALEGKITHIRDLGYTSSYTYTNNGNPPVSFAQTEPDEPLHVFLREPLSGTYNTMEFSIPNALEIDGNTFTPGVVNGQETGVGSVTGTCTVKPCTVSSQNPLWQIQSNGSTRGRAIGTGEMVTAVVNNPDSIGYAFWGFSNFQGKTGIKYLTVDGVDPLYSGPSSNPNGVGVLPSCVTSGGAATSCPNLTFPNIVNGSYPIWSKYRLIWDPTTAATNVASYFVNNIVQPISDPSTGVITDMVPLKYMQVFHSHYAQVVEDSGVAFAPNNGFKFVTVGGSPVQIPETGGDMGGAVLTITSELDFINDTGGNQQVNQFQ